MLKTLAIQNVALIDRAEIHFSAGLNVLSGETGAGKSVILDCIDFVLGAKADREMIRYGQTECSVRAEFSCDDPILIQTLGELDVEADETLIISRKLNTEGKGGAKINGCAVTSAMLRRVTSLLVDVHGQSEHFFLLKESNQLSLLDKITDGAEEGKSAVCALLDERKGILSSLVQIGDNEAERDRRLDILRYQIGEIERADLKSGEEEDLLAQKTRFQNSEKLLENLSAAQNALCADEGAWSGLDAVNAAKRALSVIVRYDGKYGDLLTRLENAASELSDIADVTREYLDELNFDERECERVENRLDEIKSLKKKYGNSIEEINAFADRAREEADLLQHSGEERERLKSCLDVCEEKLYKACVALSELRRRTAERFTARVTEELKTLNISSACFQIQFDSFGREDVGKTTRTGLDKLRFLFSANAGEPLKELGKIISGGEMSRFMLAVKTQFAGDVGTCIFDEIDAGIGGKTARVVAEKFAKISTHTQVIAVSHLAQIAAMADRQFLIEKTEENNKTTTRINEVVGEERIREIARLLTGDGGALSLRQADELLERANSFKSSL